MAVLYQTTPAWLELSREKRKSFFETPIAPIIQRFGETVQVRLFDAEAFHARITDFMILDCRDLKDYYFLMEQLRDTKRFSIPYIQRQDVIAGLENGFKEFEKTLK